MKRVFKTVLTLVFIAIAGLGVLELVKTLKEPTTGMIVVETTTATPTMEMEPMILVNIPSTVPVVYGPMEEPVKETVEIVPVVESVFKPLPFNGRRLKKFAKTNRGNVVDVPQALVKQYGGKKGVLINGTFYFKGTLGLYVFANGKIIILNN